MQKTSVVTWSLRVQRATDTKTLPAENFSRAASRDQGNSDKWCTGYVSTWNNSRPLECLLTLGRLRFLWVSPQLQHLCAARIVLEEDLREELGRLPQDLIVVYATIYKYISDLGPSS